mmetsp:Transcript_23677/g.33078  ORF Transcript_23677/g.33078 Transcript_23677/m.33078 type:complete len:142 (+) Transcript_23677:221-646(+)
MDESKGMPITAIGASDTGSVDNDLNSQLDEEKDEIVDMIVKEEKKPSPIERYNYILERKPLLTKAVTSAIIGAIGSGAGSLFDGLSIGSRSSNKRKIRLHIDFLQVLTFALHGILIQGPFDHYWLVPYACTAWTAFTFEHL